MALFHRWWEWDGILMGAGAAVPISEAPYLAASSLQDECVSVSLLDHSEIILLHTYRHTSIITHQEYIFKMFGLYIL
jgi:hypothetical protein